MLEPALAVALSTAPGELPGIASAPPVSTVSAPVDWAGQAALFEAEGRRASPGRRAAELLAEAARLRAEHLADAAAADALWRAAAAADPDFAPAALALARADEARARAEERHEERVTALERWAERSPPAEAAALLATAAAVAEDRLDRPALAADLALRAFDLAPGDAGLRREARRHAEREGRGASLSRVLLAEAADPATPARDAGLALCAVARLEAGPLGDPDQGRERLLAARRRAPDDPLVLEAAAALHEERGEWELAAEALRARAALEPRGTADETFDLLAGHLRLAALCEERLSREEEAVASYEAALALAPGHRGALAALGRLFAHAGRWDRLLATFLAERDAATDPREKAHRAFKAGEVLEERLARPDEAVERYREALALDPGLCAARQALERLHESAGRHAELAALLEEDLADTGGREERIAALARLARLHEDRLGDLAAAARAWERVLELAPAHATALRALVRLHDRAGRFQELVAASERLLAATADRSSTLAVLQRMAEVQEEQLGDPAAACLTLERVLRKDPQHRPALRGLGRLYAAAGRWGDLVAMCRAEAEVAPSPAAAAELHFRAAEILEQRLRDEAEAEAGYREVLTLAPEHLGALEALARLHRTRGAWEPLVEVLRAQAALRGAPERRAALLAEVADLWEARLGDPAHAVEVHLEALAEAPDHAPSLRALDRLLPAAGRHRELAELLQARAEAAAGAARAPLLLRRARLLAARLGDRAGALEACRAALAAAPEDGAARLLAAELEGAPAPAAAPGTDEGVAAGVREAEAHEAAGRLDEAALALRRTLIAAPGALPAVRALARVSTARGDLGEARNARRSEAALLLDDAAAAAALDAAGDLSRQLADAAGAGADWAAALERAPGDAGVAARLAALLRQVPDPAELLGGAARALDAADAALRAAPGLPDALRLRADLLARAGRPGEAARDLAALLAGGAEPAGATALHLELASLYEGPLGDGARAASHLQAALAAAPDDASALQRLAALHCRAENWPGAADALRRLLALPALGLDARRRHLLALAELRGRAFGDPAAAAALCEEALRLAPGDADAAEALARHRAGADAPAAVPAPPSAPAPAPAAEPEPASESPAATEAAPEPAVAAAAAAEPAAPAPASPPAPTRATPAAVGAADVASAVAAERLRLAADPARADTWRALLRLFEASGATERAVVAAGVLAFLDPDAPAAGPGPVTAAPPRPLEAPEWQLVRHPGELGSLSALLALAGDALAEAAQLPAPPRGRDPVPAALAQLAEEAQRTLGLRPCPLRASGDGALLTLVPGETPVIYADVARLAALPPGAQRFLLGRAAARLRGRSALPARLGAAALREILAAAVRLVLPGEASLGVPPEALARAVARAVPRKVRQALEMPARALVSAGPPDVAAWQAALASTANRAGLLLAGDPGAALEALLAETGAPANGAEARAAAARERAPLRELLLFAASEEHLALRERRAGAGAGA